MNKIIRTPTRVEGGITPDEKARMDVIAQRWINVAMRTDPIEPNKIVPAIHALYAAAGLKAPRVVIVPSPMVMAFAYGAAAWICHTRKTSTDAATRAATVDATYAATRAATVDATDAATRAATVDATDAATVDATDAATVDATDDATRAATDAATYDATHAATYAATRAATRAATDDAEKMAAKACSALAGKGGIECAKRWYGPYQGGNMWAYFGAYVEGMRDVLGLQLPVFEKYKAWEDCSLHGGFRVLHEEFCIVSDFPAEIHKDEQNRPHNEHGPSHRWRDGWCLWHWHGVKVPKEWITEKSISAAEALNWPNVEQRRAACEIIGWSKVLEQLNAKVIDTDDDEEIGVLLEAEIPESGAERFLSVKCGTGRRFVIPVPRHIQTAHEGNAWTYGLDAHSFKPEVRT